MAKQFSEKVEILDSASNVTITLDGNAAGVIAGGNGQDGDLHVRDSAGNERIWMGGHVGNISVKNVAGEDNFHVDGVDGDIIVYRKIDGILRQVMKFDASHAALYLGCEGNEGDIIVRDGAGRSVFHFDSAAAALYLGANGNEGDLQIRDGAGRTVFNFNSANAALYVGANGNEGDLQIRDGAGRTVFNFNSANAALYIGANGNEGDLQIRDGSGRTVFNFDSNYAALYIGANGNEGDIIVRDGAGRSVFHFDSAAAALYLGANGNEGDLQIRDGSGRTVFNFDSKYAALYVGANGNEGDIIVRDGAGDERIHLNGSTGDIRLLGADCAEEFDVAKSEDIDPGTVLVIDEQSKLRPCDGSYDKKVAGVVSGGNGSNPGIILDKNSTDNKRLPIALNGKVYCKVDAQYSSIEVGDLLTTSSTPGHAMKADDPLKAFGAVIGKALGSLREGKSLIPILVALQ